ncbi:hypothetical protein ACNQR7_03510 [Mycolicibacterium senegalense]|uniref:hypothetical protein n=1 Tax=Mycolicibacterium TaxID=1866885 RepID=UPI003204BC78
MNIPPNLLDKLSPSPTGGLPQSWATVIAACIAVIAAGIAFYGVWYQVRANTRQQNANREVDVRLAREQMKSQADLAREERLAEAEGVRQAERISLVRDVAELSNQAITDITFAVHERINDKLTDATQQQLLNTVRRMQLDAEMMRVLGLSKARSALLKYIVEITSHYKDESPIDSGDFNEIRREMLDVCMQDLGIADSPSGRE